MSFLSSKLTQKPSSTRTRIKTIGRKARRLGYDLRNHHPPEQGLRLLLKDSETINALRNHHPPEQGLSVLVKT